MKFELYPRQKIALADCIDYLNGKNNKPGVVVAPTAYGKSWLIAAIAKEYSGPILVLQPSIDLLHQNFEKFGLMGGKATIYSAGANSKEISHITYATLGSIKNNVSDFKKLGVKLIIWDECHFGIDPKKTSMASKFIAGLKPDKIIGLTASAFRLYPEGFIGGGSILKMITRTRPSVFKHFIYVSQVSAMIEEGAWTPSDDEIYKFDESGLLLNTSGSDFTESSILKANEANGVNNNTYLRIKKIYESGENKSVLAFMDSTATCKTMCKHLPKSAFLTSDTKKKDRKQMIEDFKSGKILHMFVYNILGTGFDFPGLQVVMVSRPMNSFAVFLQFYGRGVRISPGKDRFIFCDFGGNFERLGHPREITYENHPKAGWTLFSGDRVVTGVVLGGPPVTRQDLDNKPEKVDRTKKFPFGKHKGKLIVDVVKSDSGYITWLLGQDWLDKKLSVILTKALKASKVERLIKPKSTVTKTVPTIPF